MNRTMCCVLSLLVAATVLHPGICVATDGSLAMMRLDNARRTNVPLATVTQVEDAYRLLGKAFGIEVIFDPQLKNDRITLNDLADVTAHTAFFLVTQSAGHFYKVLDDGSVLIAQNTPQNRRQREDLVIKTWVLENADAKETDAMLRSLIEARRVSLDESLDAVTLRDTVDKIVIADRLVQILDRPRAEIEVEAEFFSCAKKPLRSALDKLERQQNGGSRLHLDRQEADHLLGASDGKHISSTRLALVGTDNAILSNVLTGEAVANLQLTGRAHPASNELTLNMEIAVHMPRTGDPKEATDEPHAQATSSMRMASGETALVTGLCLLEPDANQARELVIALTPRVSRASGYDPCELAGIFVGTESMIDASRVDELTKRCRAGR